MAAVEKARAAVVKVAAVEKVAVAAVAFARAVTVAVAAVETAAVAAAVRARRRDGRRRWRRRGRCDGGRRWRRRGRPHGSRRWRRRGRCEGAVRCHWGRLGASDFAWRRLTPRGKMRFMVFKLGRVCSPPQGLASRTWGLHAREEGILRLLGVTWMACRHRSDAPMHASAAAARPAPHG